MTPVAHELKPIALEAAFLEPPIHHRWLLTTCIAGSALSLLLGGITIGLFGQNAAPREAMAAVNKSSEPVFQTPAATSSKDNLANATRPHTEVLPERDLNDGWAYPEITENQLPYGDETTVLDSEIASIVRNGKLQCAA